MRYLLSLLALLCLLQSPAAAHAAAVSDAQGAEGLKKSIETSLSWYTDLTKASGQGITRKGDIVVTPKNGIYEIKISGVSVLTATGYRLDVGDVIVNAAPGEDGAWAISMALPTTMILYDAANAPAADLALGKQRFSALWHPALDTFSKYDAEYHDIVLKPRGNTPYSFSIGALTAVMDMVHNPDGTWSGPHAFGLEKAAFAMEDQGHASITFDKASSRGDFERVSLNDIKDTKEKIRALILPNAQDPMSAEQIKKIVSDTLRETYSFPDNYATRSEVDGLSLDFTPAQSLSQPPMHVTLAKLTMGSDMTGLKQPHGSVTGSMHVEGMSATGMQEPLAGLVPGAVNFDIRADSLPMQDLSKVFANLVTTFAQTGTSQKEEIAEEAQDALFMLPESLANAGTSIIIKDTYINARDFTTKLEGKINANKDSPLAFAGSVTLSAVGLDELIEKYRGLATSNPMALQYTQSMVPFMLMGQLEKGADGKSLRKYKVDITPAGQVLLNGLDISAAKALLAAPQAPTSKTQTPAKTKKTP
jgi:hypothetical protein